MSEVFEIEEEFNQLMTKLRAVGLTKLEEKRRQEIIRWQMNHKKVAQCRNKVWSFEDRRAA